MKLETPPESYLGIYAFPGIRNSFAVSPAVFHGTTENPEQLKELHLAVLFSLQSLVPQASSLLASESQSLDRRPDAL